MKRIVFVALSLVAVAIGGAGSDSSTPPFGSHNVNASAGFREGAVIVTLRAECVSQPSHMTSSRTQVGITSVDQVLAAHEVSKIERIVPAVATPRSDAGRLLDRTFLVFYEDQANPSDIVSELVLLPCVERAEVDQVLKSCYFGTSRAIPLDTYFNGDPWRQWSLDCPRDSVDIDAPEAWSIERGSPDVVITIIDTGTALDASGPTWFLHPDFSYLFTQEDNVTLGELSESDLDGTDATDADSLAHSDNVFGFNYSAPYNGGTAEEKNFWRNMPMNWSIIPSQGWQVSGYQKHGIQVASIAASKGSFAAPGSLNMVGVANGCKVYFVRRDSDTSFSDQIKAVVTATDFARVVNISYGFCNDPGPIYEAVFDWATIERDVVFLVAVGNTSTLHQGGCADSLHVIAPASYPSVIGVANMDSTLQLYHDSVFGPDVGDVDLVAPTGHGVPANSHTNCGDPQHEPHPCHLDWTVVSFNGTSAAAPHVAGIAALVRSRFPGLAQQDVRNRIIKSAEYYWTNSVSDSTQFGAGKVNAYRAVSEWGKITTSTMWTTNTLQPLQQGGAWVSRPGSRDGKYYISGDLTIEAGATLTIAEGTVVKVAPDHEAAGADPYRVQIVVKGTLNIAGTSSNPVVFEGFTDSAPTNNDWLGIQFEAGSSGTVSHAIIRNATTAIKSYGPLTVSNVTVEDGSFVGIWAYSGLTISNSTLRDILYPAIKLENGNLTATNVEIHDCSSGIVGGVGTGTISITGCNIHDIDDRGIEFTSQFGPLLIDQTTVDDCLDGILIGNHSSGVIDRCTIRRNDIGIWAGTSTGLVIKRSEIDSNTTNGIYLVLTQATVEADTISHSPVGVFFNTYSGGTVLGTLISNNSGVGVKCDITSSPTIRHTRITANANGVTALNNSAPNLGVAASGEECDASGANIGNNSIYSNTTYHVSNLSTGLMIAAEGNWWNADPPHASKFYGLVSREPYLCSNPNPDG